MKVINLDETGIKLITSTKKQMYLNLKEVKDFINKKYNLKDNILTINKKELPLSEKDLEEFPDIIEYIHTNFNKWGLYV